MTKHMTIDYSAHGRYNIVVEDNIIQVDAVGPFNAEFFPPFHQCLTEAVPHVELANYAVLVNLIGQAITTPEAFTEHVAFLKRAQAKAIAINLSGCHVKAISEQLFSSLYTQGGLTHQFFDAKAPALVWLKEQLTLTICN